MEISRAVDLLRASGKRITPERRLLFRVINEHAHVDASELCELAKKENPKISLSTVYRTVKLLEELGLVEVTTLGEDRHHYEVSTDEHYHFVCLGCGKVVEISPMGLLQELGKRQGLEIVGATLELSGYCPQCRRKRAGKKAAAA